MEEHFRIEFDFQANKILQTDFIVTSSRLLKLNVKLVKIESHYLLKYKIWCISTIQPWSGQSHSNPTMLHRSEKRQHPTALSLTRSYYKRRKRIQLRRVDLYEEEREKIDRIPFARHLRSGDPELRKMQKEIRIQLQRRRRSRYEHPFRHCTKNKTPLSEKGESERHQQRDRGTEKQIPTEEGSSAGEFTWRRNTDPVNYKVSVSHELGD